MVRVRSSPSTEYNPEGYIRLANAIVTLAAKDYRRALIALKKNSHIIPKKGGKCSFYLNLPKIKDFATKKECQT